MLYLLVRIDGELYGIAARQVIEVLPLIRWRAELPRKAVIAKSALYFASLGGHGRNVPDLSVNADPETGYIVPYTSSVDGPTVEFLGGTSFSSPQLNGVTSLYNQALGHRLGLINVPLYDLVRRDVAYRGPHAPLRDIVHGDNWFYSGHAGYDQGTGVGVPDVTNLLRALQGYY